MPSTKRHRYPKRDLPNTPIQGPKCPICDTNNAEYVAILDPGGSPFLQGWCPACTNFFVTARAVEEARQGRKAHLLSAYLRRLPEENLSISPIFEEDLEAIYSSTPEISVVDQFDLALKTICEMCPMIGEPSRFDCESDWPLLMVESPRAAYFIGRELGAAGYLAPDSYREFGPPFSPTWKAYVRLQEIQSSGRSSEIGFVAMSFADEFLPVWNQVIKPGINDAGYREFRVDQKEHNNRIDDEIIANIRRCRFLVADFTGQRNGVYFEAGMALGLGRNVIWMCSEDDRHNLHFDTRQFNHILYSDFEQAKRALTNRIVALEGQGRLPANYIGG